MLQLHPRFSSSLLGWKPRRRTDDVLSNQNEKKGGDVEDGVVIEDGDKEGNMPIGSGTGYHFTGTLPEAPASSLLWEIDISSSLIGFSQDAV